MKNLTRRHFLSQSLRVGAGLSLWPLVSSCTRRKSHNSLNKKVVILGIDGMDPFLLGQFVMEGDMPNFRRLIQTGSFNKMLSSIPPQSPVAWSDFAVGASAGVHGIFDFIHRDPRTMRPYLSISEVTGASKTFELGDWRIPLGAGETKQLREGKPFWEYLSEAGIPSTIFKMPGNFPADSEDARCISGMGTPDLLGTYGMFTYFTSSPREDLGNITGGRQIRVSIINNKIDAELLGPANTLKTDKQNVRIPFVVWRDPKNDVVKIEIQNKQLIMTPGEWSDWVGLSFDLAPYIKSVNGICKFLIKQIHPDFEMYVSPINIDPHHQVLPVSSPEEYGRELAHHIGLFGTKGLPADTKALSYGVLSEEEYLQSSQQIYAESRRAMQYELGRLQQEQCGVLFFYYSNLDQDSHMYWRAIDREHPLYTHSLGLKYSHVLKELYVKMDEVLGDVYEVFDINDDNFTLIIMSDHGFAPFYRSVNLNTWLAQNGYISLADYSPVSDSSFFENVNWSKTLAYGLGINALYLNLAGRERYGAVPNYDAPKILAKLKKELLALRDPINGENAVSRVWLGREIYKRADDKVPDLIIGWNRGYRASWETILGGFPRQVFVDNDDKWSGDHCIDPFWVPAVFVSNKKVVLPRLTLPDITATVLAECGIPIPAAMTGQPIFL